MKNNKIFHITIFAYFVIVGAFHFIRLALDWKIILVTSQKDYSLNTLVSALCFLFSAFMIYWVYKQKKKDNKIEVRNIEEVDN
jgi:hypothetical protein